jgi:hypothetical protein
MAAETVAWWLFGGKREDHNCPFLKPHMGWVWVAWEARRYICRMREIGPARHGE